MPRHRKTADDRANEALAAIDLPTDYPRPTPQSPAEPYPVEYRWGIQQEKPRHEPQFVMWICTPCLATRAIRTDLTRPIIIDVIHADPADPHPTCADCEARAIRADKP